MTDKKKTDAKALRNKKRLAKYFHPHGYARISGTYTDKKDRNVYRSRILFVIIAVFVLAVGLFYVIF